MNGQSGVSKNEKEWRENVNNLVFPWAFNVIEEDELFFQIFSYFPSSFTPLPLPRNEVFWELDEKSSEFHITNKTTELGSLFSFFPEYKNGTVGCYYS